MAKSRTLLGYWAGPAMVGSHMDVARDGGRHWL